MQSSTIALNRFGLGALPADQFPTDPIIHWNRRGSCAPCSPKPAEPGPNGRWS